MQFLALDLQFLYCKLIIQGSHQFTVVRVEALFICRVLLGKKTPKTKQLDTRIKESC